MKKTTIVVIGTLMLLFCGGKKEPDIRAPGIVEGEIITLKSLVPGGVDRLPVREGAGVTAGQLLVEINSAKTENKLKELDIRSSEMANNQRKITQKLKLVRSTIQYLENQVERFQRLKEKKSIPGERLESMQLKLLEARTNESGLLRSLDSLGIQSRKIENQREYLQLLLRDHRIKSPVQGVLMETFVARGENVFPGTPLVDLLNTASLYIDVFIEEREISSLKLGQRARIIVDGMEDRALSGSVSYFGKKAEFSPKYVISEKERKSLLYRVKIAIDRDISLFKIGMPVTVILRPGHPE